MSYIRLVNVTKRFGNVTAVDNLNLEIGKGECFSMLGPSGCGKTTTLRMVAGFEDLSDGEVWLATVCCHLLKASLHTARKPQFRHGVSGFCRMAAYERL